MPKQFGSARGGGGHGHSHGGQPCHGHGESTAPTEAPGAPGEQPAHAHGSTPGPSDTASSSGLDAEEAVGGTGTGMVRAADTVLGEWRVLKSRFARCLAERARLREMQPEFAATIDRVLRAPLTAEGQRQLPEIREKCEKILQEAAVRLRFAHRPESMTYLITSVLAFTHFCESGLLNNLP